jgi:fumarate reductase flavoprotein subunit
MAAAATAAEMGGRVTVFEKGSDLAFGGFGPYAVESKLQRMQRITFTREDAFRFFMEHTHYRADARLVKAYVDKTASNIDWFEELGMKFVTPLAYFPGGKFVWHGKDPNSPRFTDVMADRAKKFGAVIYLETPAKQIFKENGLITGLLAEDKSGEAIRVKAGAVIIATGGFSENPKWVKKYTGHELGRNLFLMQRDPPLWQGDGIRMAWEVGAADTPMYIDTCRGMPQPYGGPGGITIELGTFRQPNLMVNLLGERFVNEEIVFDGAASGNAVDAQKNRCAFMIVDQDNKEYYENNDWDWLLPLMPDTKSPDIAAIIRKARDDGYQHLFMADSLEELCAQTGINLDGLRNTLGEYNKACETGRDELFYKKANYLKPVKRPKFYAARFFLGGYVGLGGVKINYKTEVLTKDYDVIPGLYTVGNDSNTVCGDTYVFALAGHMSGFAFSTGRIAGENASTYIKNGK